MHRVVIVGGGVGGMVAAHELRRQLAVSDQVTVIEQSPVHTFWPSLLWITGGTRKADQVTRPFSDLREKGIQVVHARVDAIDPQIPAVSAAGQTYTGDALILALGADLAPSLVPGLETEAGDLYTVAGAESIHSRLAALQRGRVVVLVSRVPFKCPAAPYEAAMLIDGYLRQKRRRDQVQVEVWAAEATPMGVAGPGVSQAVAGAVRERDIAYHPSETVERVADGRLYMTGGHEVAYDLLAYVSPHVAPPVVVAAGLAPAGGWVAVNRLTLETKFPNVFAIGDVTGIGLALGKPLPKAGTFAHRQAEAVAETVARRLTGKVGDQKFSGVGECFVEMGRGVAGFARGNFYQEPLPDVHVYKAGKHWHAAKVAFERHWWRQWW